MNVRMLMLYGPTGIGKSTGVLDILESLEIPYLKIPASSPDFKPKQLDFQSCYILDEFQDRNWHTADFNEMLDKHPPVFNIKHGEAQNTAMIIIGMTNIPKDTWFRKEPQSVRNVVWRRILWCPVESRTRVKYETLIYLHEECSRFYRHHRDYWNKFCLPKNLHLPGGSWRRTGRWSSDREIFSSSESASSFSDSEP